MNTKPATLEDLFTDLVLTPLGDLARAREAAASADDSIPMVTGVTHCESCGFHKRARRSVVTHRDLCQTPEWHDGPSEDIPYRGMDVRYSVGLASPYLWPVTGRVFETWKEMTDHIDAWLKAH